MLLVTGCPRSATCYAAKVFRHHGLDVVHEDLGADGTSDWQLAGLPFGEPVLHQVRCPKNVIASMETMRDKSWQYMNTRLSIEHDERDVEHRCRLWLGWTELADLRASFRYRVEEIRSVWPTIQRYVSGLLAWDGDDIWPAINSRPHTELSWNDIAACESGQRVIDKARRYGYEVTL